MCWSAYTHQRCATQLPLLACAAAAQLQVSSAMAFPAVPPPAAVYITTASVALLPPLLLTSILIRLDNLIPDAGLPGKAPKQCPLPALC
jgi:hypothetical protein